MQMQQQSYVQGSPVHQGGGNDVSPYTGMRCYDIDRALRLLPEASQAELAILATVPLPLSSGAVPYSRYLEILSARAERVRRHIEYHAKVLEARNLL